MSNDVEIVLFIPFCYVYNMVKRIPFCKKTSLLFLFKDFGRMVGRPDLKSIIVVMVLIPILTTSKSYSRDYKEHLSQGIKYFDEYWHKEDLALKEFKKAAELKPEDPEVLFWLGRGLFHMGDFEKANEVLNKAARLAPDDYRVIVYLAINYGRLGEQSLTKQAVYKFKAIQQIRRALKLNPKCSHAHNAWGVGYGYLGFYGKAEKHLKKSLEVNPDNYWTYMQLGGTYLMMDREAEGKEMLRKAMDFGGRVLRDGKKNDEIPRTVALYYEEAGYFKEALEHAKTALEWNPEDRQILPRFSIKKLIKRLEKEVATGKPVEHNMPDELIVGGID